MTMFWSTIPWLDIPLLAGAAAAAVAGCGGTGEGARPPRPAAIEPAFSPRQVSRVYTQSLAAPPDEIMPLLTPLGEKAWARGWDPTILFEAPPPGSGTVFTTRHADRPETTWLLETFDPVAGHVRYIHMTPGSDVTEIDIALARAPGSAGRTEATVRYTYTGFSKRGNDLVDSMTEEHYRHFMMAWEQELNDYLARR